MRALLVWVFAITIGGLLGFNYNSSFIPSVRSLLIVCALALPGSSFLCGLVARYVLTGIGAVLFLHASWLIGYWISFAGSPRAYIALGLATPFVGAALAFSLPIGLLGVFLLSPLHGRKTSTEALACPNCGYSLQGLGHLRCPECGFDYSGGD